MLAKFKEFSTDYQALNNEIKQLEASGRNLDELDALVNGYAGIISVNAYANYGNVVDEGRGGSGFYGDTSQWIVGTTPRQTVSRGQTPVVTEQGASQIGNAL